MKAQINRVVIELIEDDLLSQSAEGLVVQVGPNLRLPPDVAAKAGAEVHRQIAILGRLTRISAVYVDGSGIDGKKVLLALTSGSSETDERNKLATITYECLHLAETHGLGSLAFPALMGGLHDYPVENCATIMLSQIVDYTFEDLEHLRAVTICLSDAVACDIFEQELLSQIDDLRRSNDGTVSL